MNSMSYGPGSVQEAYRRLYGGQDHRRGLNTFKRALFWQIQLLTGSECANAGHVRQSEVWPALSDRRAGGHQGKPKACGFPARTPR